MGNRTLVKSKIVFLVVLCIMCVSLRAEGTPHNISVKSYYEMIEGMETLESAKNRAHNIALQQAVEQAGIYVESYTRVSNYQLVSDEIKVIAGSNMKVLNENYTIINENETRKIVCDMSISIDSDNLDIKARMQDKKALEESAQQYVLLQQKNKELMDENESLKRKFIKERGTENESIVMREFEKNNFDLQQNDDLVKANVLIDKKNYTDATELLDQVIGESPDSDAAYNLRGIVSYRKKLYSEAIKFFNKAIDINSGNIWYYNNRAMAYMGNGQYQEGMVDINKAIEFRGDKSGLYINRGYLNSNLGNVMRAIDDFSMAIKIDINCADAYCDRGTEYLKIGEYGAAISDFNKAISINPNDPKTWCNRGTVYYSQKQYLKAYEDYSVCLNLKPDIVLAYHNRGICLFSLGRYSEAIKDFELRNHLEPNSIAYLIQGMCFANLGDVSSAIEIFDESIALNSNNLRAHLFKAQLCYKVGRTDDARNEYREVLRINPTHKEARSYLRLLS